MNCHEFGLIVRDYGRQQWLNASQRAEAQSHVTGCADCQGRLSAELAMEAKLGALGGLRKHEPMPDLTHRDAIDAFRRRSAAGKRWWTRRPMWIAIPVAATLVLFGVALRMGWEKRNTPEAASVAPERVTDFVPLRFGKPVEPGETLQVIRIQMRRSELMQLGMPVSPDLAANAVKADVVLGEDGLAKAIRLVY